MTITLPHFHRFTKWRTAAVLPLYNCIGLLAIQPFGLSPELVGKLIEQRRECKRCGWVESRLQPVKVR